MPKLKDDDNPRYMFSCTSTELMIKIVSGEIDPIDLARKELKNRGLNEAGVWNRKVIY